jgi:hypothetical protein
MNPQFWWYVARSSGIISWLMITGTVIWGVILSTKAFPEQRRPAWILDLHRWLGGLAVGFLVLHLADVLVPGHSAWRPGSVALGVVAAWTLVAVEGTSLAIKKLPKKVWRGIHLTSYATFWLTSLHAAFAGSDRSTFLYQITALGSIVAVAWAAMYRVANRRSLSRRTAS